MEFSCYSPGHRCGVSRVRGAGEAFPTRHVECTLRAFVEKAMKTRRGGNVSFVEYDVPVTLRRRALRGDVRCVVLLIRPLLKYNKWRGGGSNRNKHQTRRSGFSPRRQYRLDCLGWGRHFGGVGFRPRLWTCSCGVVKNSGFHFFSRFATRFFDATFFNLIGLGLYWFYDICLVWVFFSGVFLLLCFSLRDFLALFSSQRFHRRVFLTRDWRPQGHPGFAVA